MKIKKHLLRTYPFDAKEYALCGNEKAWYLVPEIDDVTCKNCLRRWWRE